MSDIPKLPADSIHGPTSANPSPSKGLSKLTSPNTQSREDVRTQLEEVAISLRSGSKKGRHVIGIFDLPVLVAYIYQRESALLEEVKAEAPKDEPVRHDPKTVESMLKGQPYPVDNFNAGINEANKAWRKALSSVRKEHGLSDALAKERGL